MMLKIARRAYQAIFVGGSGPVPNRLPHDFWVKSSMGAMSLDELPCINNNFDSWKLQVTLALPNNWWFYLSKVMPSFS